MRRTRTNGSAHVGHGPTPSTEMDEAQITQKNGPNFAQRVPSPPITPLPFFDFSRFAQDVFGGFCFIVSVYCFIVCFIIYCSVFCVPPPPRFSFFAERLQGVQGLPPGIRSAGGRACVEQSSSRHLPKRATGSLCFKQKTRRGVPKEGQTIGGASVFEAPLDSSGLKRNKREPWVRPLKIQTGSSCTLSVCSEGPNSFPIRISTQPRLPKMFPFKGRLKCQKPSAP